MNVKIEVTCPISLWSRGLSDHAVLSVKATKRHNAASPCTKIPVWVVKLPSYKEALQQLLAVADLANLLPAFRLDHYKELMREAARIARDEHSDRYRDTAPMRLHNVVLMARLTARNNVPLARKLISTSAFFVSRLQIV